MSFCTLVYCLTLLALIHYFVSINDMNSNSIALSIVIPVYNEDEVLDTLFATLSSFKEDFKSTFSILGDIELIFVTDQPNGSTLEKLKQFCESHPLCKTLNLSQRSGQYIAIQAGLHACKGDAAVIMDADLQDPPQVILTFYKFSQQGYDVVYGVRRSRDGETWLYTTLASLFYSILNTLSPISIPKNSGEFRLLSRRAIDAISQLNERNRYFRGLSTWVGFKQKGVPFHRD